MADVFEEIRNSLPIQTVARFYGINVGRNGMACCPFHEDHNPSLKLYKYDYYCFGCGAEGDATDFVSRLYGIKQIDAAKKISYDFGLGLFDKEFAAPVKRQLSENQKYNMWLKSAEENLKSYVTLLRNYREKYAPKRFTEEPDPRFVESLLKLDYAEELWFTLKCGSDEDKWDLYLNGRKEVEDISDRLNIAEKAGQKKNRLL